MRDLWAFVPWLLLAGFGLAAWLVALGVRL